MAVAVHDHAELALRPEPAGEGLSHKEIEKWGQRAALADPSMPGVTCGLDTIDVRRRHSVIQ
jgi:hypothetical protein